MRERSQSVHLKRITAGTLGSKLGGANGKEDNISHYPFLSVVRRKKGLFKLENLVKHQIFFERGLESLQGGDSVRRNL